MGLSITGEFYANFGVFGGWVAMFIYGLVLSVIIRRFVTNAGKTSPIAIIWLVLLFYQLVKAETELIKIINHLFKSLIVFT
ncbi:MAG: multisubunit Na+/H+ antiporter MnhE subunit [Vicingaceae bacterium]|jgi:multisubunit Na+/H+ antiporter MnhE subunit